MDDLTAFWRTRLDEDEAAGRAAASVAGEDWQFGMDFPTSYLRSARGGILADTLQSGEGQIGPHLARHDPARVRREVKADRAILALLGRDVTDGRERGCDATEALEQVVRIRAAIHGGHPDYRPEWKP